MREIRLFEAFAGLGSQHRALKNINKEITLTGICEWDMYAVISYATIHGYDLETGIEDEPILENIKKYF